MATPIKRVGLIVTIALLLMVSAFASVAYAKTLLGRTVPTISKERITETQFTASPAGTTSMASSVQTIFTVVAEEIR